MNSYSINFDGVQRPKVSSASENCWAEIGKIICFMAAYKETLWT